MRDCKYFEGEFHEELSQCDELKRILVSIIRSTKSIK
jgi:hypothetical protein